MVAWLLVLHLTGLALWLGSLLVVTRVLAMHAQETSADTRSALARLEMILLKGLAHPGAALMATSGIILLILLPYAWRELWMQAKILCVLLLVALDLRVYFRAKAFQAGRIEMQRGECMALHGAIAFVFLAILILVLIKPFT
jgi:uncharacterized membrane protein